MAFELAIELAKSHESGDGENSSFGERGVKDRRGVSLGEDEAIAFDGVGIPRIEMHGVKKSGGDELGAGKAGSGMAGAGGGGHAHGMDAKKAGFFAHDIEGVGCGLSHIARGCCHGDLQSARWRGRTFYQHGAAGGQRGKNVGAIGKLLYATGATDPLTLAGVSTLLLLLVTAASYVPARRALRLDPIETLREV